MNTSQQQMYSLPDSDLELLSSYIDNRLGAAERAELERRLGAEPRLRAELEDLRATTTLLRELDPLPLPRSFTLDRATAPRRRSFLSLAWLMQLSGGLAGLALVLMASLQMMGSMAAPSASMSSVGSMPTLAPVAARQTEATQAPAATQEPTMAEVAAAPMAVVAAPTSGPAATAASLSAAAVAPASDAVQQTNPVGGSSLPDTHIPVTPAPMPTAKAVPARAEFPVGLSFGLGVVLLALAIGSFVFTRSRR
ncbi:MAG: hypothetical protein WCK70_09870 [Chloroflexales bacterium]|jgi:hypothetical protein